MLPPGSPIRVRKLHADGSPAYAWDGTVLRCDAEGIVLSAVFNVPLVDLGFTTLRAGDLFVETYYWDRWYNVFQISHPDGSLKGWYANVGMPARLVEEEQDLSYVDLELDVWANPDGTFDVLDQTEFTALLETLGPGETARGALEGRDALLALAATGTFPHWPEESR